jgi:hypothetical protein
LACALLLQTILHWAASRAQCRRHVHNIPFEPKNEAPHRAGWNPQLSAGKRTTPTTTIRPEVLAPGTDHSALPLAQHAPHPTTQVDGLGPYQPHVSKVSHFYYNSISKDNFKVISTFTCNSILC